MCLREISSGGIVHGACQRLGLERESEGGESESPGR